LKTGKVLGIYFLAGSVSFAAHVSPAMSDSAHDGLFVGLGANYNSVNVTQDSWGLGVSNIQTSTGANSNGVAQGNGVPFHNVSNGLGPNFQAGYFKHISGTPNFAGVKFSYQFLNAVGNNANLFIPQIGQTTSAITGVTSPLYGYVNGTSIQPIVNHEVSFLLFGGRTFGNMSFYLGVGPSLINMQSKNYYSIGYAIAEGATVNVTGLVSYNSPTFWNLGGTAQMGATYYISPTWFIDMSYAYTVTGNYTTNHQQAFANKSSLGTTVYNTSGTLYTKDTLKVTNQSLMLTLNKVLDV
jgi:hypothetical protein